MSELYQVEVLHYLNPHLIWVEATDQSVGSSEFVFEQIGIYGLLPLEPVFDVEKETFKTQECDNWSPATLVTIKEALAGVQDIWFSPTHIDRRSSIFDNNVHKYGDLLLKHNNKLVPLSNILLKSGFAIKDVCLFHQKLSLGKLKTKLQTSECHAVIKEIEKYYINKNVPKNDWERSVKTHTTVAHAAQELESALTEINLEKHNNKFTQKILQSKMNDFEMCKDVDEASVGRAYKKKLNNVQVNLKNNETSALHPTKYDIKSILLKRKLAVMALKKTNGNDLDVVSKNDTKQILDNTKIFLESNAKVEVKEGPPGFVTDFNVNSYDSNNEISMEGKQHNEQEYNVRVRNSRGNKLEKILRKQNDTTIKKNISSKAVYGPPGVAPTKLSSEVMIKSFVENHPVNKEGNKEENNEKDDLYANVDSDVGIEITNKNILMMVKEGKDKVNEQNYVQSREKLLDNEENNSRKPDQNDNSHVPSKNISASNKEIKSSNSKLLQRKLTLHKNKKSKILNSSLTSCSDTTNKDSSSSSEVINDKQNDKRKKVTEYSSEDKDIEGVIKKINEEYSATQFSNTVNKPTPHYSNYNNCNLRLKNSVNPFRNIDPKMSMFVDKIVTPVMMVHTKMNKRIEPVLNIRDVYFNNNINLALKNMSVERPMMLQTISWFCILRGYSTFLISPVGSGKTLGYLPAVCRLVSDSCAATLESVGPTCIILCATAKSVTEVEKMAKVFLGTQDKVLSCFAGVDESYVTTSLLNGCNLLISTPSFLVRLLQITDFGVDLRNLATFVLDDCERLDEIYSNELKYIIFKIKESLKIRTNKELRVQYVVASRNWCKFIEPIAKKAPYSVVCIGAFQECVLYSKVGMTVNFVEFNAKLNAVHDFLTQVDITKKTVIVCNTDMEVFSIKKSLKKYTSNIFACDSSMSIQDLNDLRIAWDEYEDPLMGPILLCCHDTLIYFSVTDANNLLIYSLPNLFSTFCKQFSVLNDNYPSIFKTDSETVKIKILIEDSAIQQLPKLLNFIKRCNGDVPQYLNHLCDNVMAEKDMAKAAKLIPICDNLLSLGYCPEYWNCHSRHTVIKNYDNCKDWVPTEGIISFKILYYHSAVVFSARLLSKSVKGVTYKYPQTYSSLSLKMGMYYSKESNRIPHGIPKVGDMCAVSIKQNFFARCQVVTILNKYHSGNPNRVLVKLLDEERLESTRDIYLYYLPEELNNIVTHVVQVRLANVQPKDKDVTYSYLARDELKMITDNDEDLYIRGQVVMAIGNCVFVDTLEACQDLTSLNKTVVKNDFKQSLLKRYAVPNAEHINIIKNLCKGTIQTDVNNDDCKPEAEKQIACVNTAGSGSWAYLESEYRQLVRFGTVVSPDLFFVQLSKFERCLNLLLKEIQTYVADNPELLHAFKEGDIVLAMFPDDAMYERARIDSIIGENKVKCFFVDQGDWRELSTQHISPIREEFITKLPFQAIECRLIGVKPEGESWTDFSINWFYDKCYDNYSDSKYMYVKYFTKENANVTGGNRYSVVLIDTNGEVDAIINRSLINTNLAKENISEIKYLNEFSLEHSDKSESCSDQDKTDELDIVDEADNKSELCAGHAVTESPNTLTLDTIFKQPIRSVPLVDSDYEDSDESERWNIHNPKDFLKIFRPFTNNCEKTQVNDLPVIAANKTKNDVDKAAEEKCISIPKPSQAQNDVSELHSDDYTSPESSEDYTRKTRNVKSLLETNENRKPRVVWRQNKQIVYIKINLIGLKTYDVKIEGKSLSFAATLDDVYYAFDIELYGSVDVAKSLHSNKGQYVLVKLFKILHRTWLSLTKDGEIRKWIVYDMDSIDASSGEEETEDHTKDTMLNALKNICKQEDSESGDDDLIDDTH